MMIELKVIRRISKAEGKFSAYGPGDRKLMCYLHDKDDWDKIVPDTAIMVKGSIMSGDNFMVLAIMDANDIDAVHNEEKAKAKATKRAMYKNWVFSRWLGLRDIPTIFKTVRNNVRINKDSRKNNRLESPEHWSQIIINHDTQVDSWVEPMAAGTQSCPYWDSVRLFYGKEANFDWGKKPFEYFLGIRQTFLAPIIPIPICSYEVVYILGESDKPFRECKKKYGRARSFYDHAEEFGAVKIYDKMDTYFIQCDKSYKNDPVYSTCG